ncbi:universal stress protein [Nocardioides oleivorans]|uniref:Universal stress protein n=1 Tax=Nocardioides oleivorans TaxID=273676 RepID=A0A4Q2RTQ9_9ACTN|nr:universal stress protein [Nocardioides oleivorans]RYB92006.1 universal stress protein [Nocardioides oleivorans]
MTVLLGYDESPGSEAALAAAIEVATKFGEDLVLVYGAAPPGGMGDEARVHREALMEMGRTATAHALSRAQDAGIEVSVRLVDAKPADALVQVGDELDATVIVVGTAGDSPFRGALLGSTPHKLLHLSDRPVLCVPVGR